MVLLQILLQKLTNYHFQWYSLLLVINEVLLMDDPQNPCVRALCIHGDCRPLANTYECDCHWGYQGPHCGKGEDQKYTASVETCSQLKVTTKLSLE